MTVVGSDEFGHFLRERLAAEGVDVSHLRQTTESRTGLVFISLDARGRAQLHVLPDAARRSILLGERDVDAAFLAQTKVLHWGSNSLHLPEARVAMQHAVECVRGAGRIVSCDPNLRLHAWADPERGQGHPATGCCRCSTVVKLSEEEMPFVTGYLGRARGAGRILRGMGVLAARGDARGAGRGVSLAGRAASTCPRLASACWTPPVPEMASWRALLYGLTRRYSDAQALRGATRESLTELITFACVVGSRVVERLGAVAGLPRAQEVASTCPPTFGLAERRARLSRAGTLKPGESPRR